MNVLPLETRVRIVSALVEGNSLRSTSRMFGVSINTITKLLVDMGEVCEDFHDRTVRNLQSERIQADEIWSFCYAKDKNLPASMRGEPGVGSVWTWTAIDADSKLMVSWYIGDRDAECATNFMHDLAGRLGNRVQLTTDGHNVYERAVGSAFGWKVDYAQLVKVYGAPRDGEARYSPCECLGAKPMRVCGQPVMEDVSTSYVERSNLSMRMGMRRFTRLTNGFSKKLANHRAAVALYMVHYNFCRVHKTLRVTPAMEAGISDHVWTLEELVGLLQAEENRMIVAGSLRRGSYKRRRI